MKRINLFLVIWLVVAIALNAQTTITIKDCVDCTPEVTTLDCAAATFNNTEYISGEEFQASMMIPYTGGNGSPIPGLSASSTGITGLTADLVGGNLASGPGSLIFYVHGTPSGAGTASFAISFGGQSCTVDLGLTEAAAPSASLVIGEVCPLMMDIQDWSHTATSEGSAVGSSAHFLTSNGEIWSCGDNQGSGDLGFPATGNDAVDENTPYINNFYTPSPSGAIYRQGLAKTWVSLEESPAISNQPGGVYAINSDNELWTWGGTLTHWDRPAHGTIPAGQNYWDAWQILPPAGLAGFTQIYQQDYRVAWARGTDGKLYSWGGGGIRAAWMGHSPFGPTTSVTVLEPTRAVMIPHSILDSKYAVIPNSSNARGCIFIDDSGDVYVYGQALAPSTGDAEIPELINLPAGVKATKITGARGTGFIFCLGDDGKLYFYHVGVSTQYPAADARTALNITATSQAAHTWNEFDPEGAGGIYHDITANELPEGIGVAVTDDGNVFQFNMRRFAGPNVYDLNVSTWDITEVWSTGGSGNPTFVLKGSDGRSFAFAPTTVPGNDTGSGGNTDAGSIGPLIGGYMQNPPNGPYLMNCYVNPTGVNNATAPGN